MSDFFDSAMILLKGAFLACLARNVLLGRAFGSESLMTRRNKDETAAFGILQGACCLLSTAGFWLLERYVLPHALVLTKLGLPEYYARAFMWPLCSAVAVSAAYMLLFVVTVKLAPLEKVNTAVKELPFACFNTLVAGILVLGGANGHSLLEMMGFAIGNFFSVIVIGFFMREGEKKMEENDAPAAFKGLPASLLYLAGLALAAYAFVGHRTSSIL